MNESYEQKQSWGRSIKPGPRHTVCVLEAINLRRNLDAALAAFNKAAATEGETFVLISKAKLAELTGEQQ